MSTSKTLVQQARQEDYILYARLRKIAESAGSDPYEKKSIFANIFAQILDSIRWRLNYRLSTVKPHQNWYLAASLWPLLVESEEKSLHVAILKEAIDKQLDKSGFWRYPLDTAYKFLMCTHVVRLWELTGDERYINAATDALRHLNKMKRASNGAFLYIPARDEILVDTLGMICPFLGACAEKIGNKEAAGLLEEQLGLYWENNMDAETGLPYHGYYSGGPNKLGSLGWGRGVGWYMLALSSVQDCHQIDDSLARQINRWMSSIVQTLIKWQRNDGHWNDHILIRSRADSSATGMIILALTSARLSSIKPININSELLNNVIRSGRQALLKSIGRKGLISGSSGEASALGSYSHAYGSFPWSQGFGSAALVQSYRWLEMNGVLPVSEIS